MNTTQNNRIFTKGRTMAKYRAGRIRRRSSASPHERKKEQLLDDAKRLLAGFPGKTQDMNFLIDAAGTIVNTKMFFDRQDDEEKGDIPIEFESLNDSFIQTLERDELPPYLTEAKKAHAFTPMDLRIILILASGNIGLGPSIQDIEDLQNLMCFTNQERLELIKHFLPEGRLVMSRVVEVDPDQEAFKDSGIRVSESFVKPLLRDEGRFSVGWTVASQEELLDKLSLLRRSFMDCVENLDYNDGCESTLSSMIRTRERLIDAFAASIHPDWPIAAIFSEKFGHVERRIILSLLCRVKCMSLRRHIGGDLYTGEGLARTAAMSIVGVPKIIREKLLSNSQLVADKIIKPILRGTAEQETEDEDTVRRIEFELTEEFLAELKIKPKKDADGTGRKPLAKMDNLILAADIKDALRYTLSQITNHDLLYKDWGLGDIIPYGQAVTLLFSGPPGVGKTACAEAIADELGKNIVVADYSQLQNCFVGETEKNITRLFRGAGETGAVLFFDECDAMFYDRDTSNYNWETRSVNVLLQELEKFTGVCILSTNRKVILDKALARRVSMKLEFKPPTKDEARQIWRKLFPDTLPLADDIDIDLLADSALTGGEIKNVVLNAARRAAARQESRQLCMADFVWALEKEVKGKDFSGDARGMIGFKNNSNAAV